MGNITNSMEQSPSWETNNHSASQEIPRLVRNPKVRYRVHSAPGPYPEPHESSPHPPALFLKNLF
jgi:hypothetical protein